MDDQKSYYEETVNKSENIVKYLYLDIFIYSKASSIALNLFRLKI